MAKAPSSPQRVFLHVGAPKTGTTFVQGVLFEHREVLRGHGICYPAERYDDHFFAAVDLQHLDFVGEHRPEAAGMWSQVAARARAWPATSVISHDVFAGVSRDHARNAIASLEPAEVHVVLTARDLARQLPSHWQEDVKHGSTRTFADWYAAVQQRGDPDWFLRWFWRAQHIPEVLDRWSAAVPPERIHVVTLAHQGSPGDLWRRFASVLDLDPGVADIGAVRDRNRGLGVAEVELLRRLNQLPDPPASRSEYEHAVKGMLAHETLAHKPDKRHFGLPSRYHARLEAVSRGWVRALEVAGYDVVGDLRDLLPGPPSPLADPDSATDEEVAAAAVYALQRMALRAHADARRLSAATGEVEQLRAEVDALAGRLHEHEALPPWERVKRTVVEIGRTNQPVGRMLGAYRRVRRR